MRRWKVTFRGFFRASHDPHCGETIIPQKDKALFSTVINIMCWKDQSPLKTKQKLTNVLDAEQESGRISQK